MQIFKSQKMKYNYEKILNDIDNKHIRLGQEIEDYKYRLSYIDVDLKNIAENFFFIKEKVKNKKVMNYSINTKL